MNAINNVLAIAGKELRYYFGSPIGYVVIGLFAGLFGFFYYPLLAYFLQESLQMMGMGGMAGAPAINVNQNLIQPLLVNVSIMILLALPAVTMRTYSEEKRSGTIELLLTSPLRDAEIVFGKFVASMTLYAAMLGSTLIHIGVLYAFGRPEWQPIVTGYIGLLLMGACFVALGLFISSLTRNQIVAAMGTFAAFLMFWVINWAAPFMGPTTQAVLNYLSIIEHLDDFTRGIVDTKHVVYYLSFISFALFLTVRSVDSERWRG